MPIYKVKPKNTTPVNLKRPEAEKDFEWRAKHSYNFIYDPKTNSFSTHKMAQSDNIAYPTIVQKSPGSPLTELTPKEAYDYAIKTGQYKKFDTEEQAKVYAEGGYKQGTQLEQNNNRMAPISQIPIIKPINAVQDNVLRNIDLSSYEIGLIKKAHDDKIKNDERIKAIKEQQTFIGPDRRSNEDIRKSTNSAQEKYEISQLPTSDIRSQNYVGNPNLAFATDYRNTPEILKQREEAFNVETRNAFINVPITMGIDKGIKYVTPLVKSVVESGIDEVGNKIANTYKINPWRFKPNPNAYYHRSPNLTNIINKEKNILQGFGESEAGKKFNNEVVKFKGLNLRKAANSQLYFSKGVPLDFGRYNKSGQGYKGPYMIEVENIPMGASVKGRKPSINPPTRIEGYAVSHRPINIDEAKFYKEHWLKGYKEVPKTKIK